LLNVKTSEFNKLKEDILKYIKSLDNFDDIQKELTHSTIDLLASLIAGYASYTNFKFSMNREETFLQTAKLPSSIFQIAFTLGYRIQRAKAPIIKLRYYGDDKILNTGDIIGKYEDYDLIYFDYSKKIKTNDYIYVKLGKYFEFDYDLLLQKFNVIELNPQFLRSIDNDDIFIEDNQNFYRPSIKFEDFIINNKIVNWSKTNTDALIYINDKENNFGNLDVNKLKIKYIETNGKIESFNFKKIKFFDKNFAYIDVYFYGINEDSLDKIKKIAPNLRNTKSRAVTLDDYYYYIMNTNLFDDIYVEPEQNIPANWKLEFNEFDDFDRQDTEYSLTIEGSYVSLIRYSYETLNEFKVRFYNELLKNELVIPKLIKKEDNTGYDLFLEQKFLEREISIKGKNIEIIKLNDFVRAQSCVLNVYYVKKGNDVIRQSLTTSELLYLDYYIKNFSIVGIKIVYIPAVPKVANISLGIKIVDPRFKDEVYNYVKKTIEKYQYKINSKFEINKIISELIKYKSYLNGVEIYPIQYIKNLSDDDIINTSKYEYLVFYGIDISFI